MRIFHELDLKICNEDNYIYEYGDQEYYAALIKECEFWSFAIFARGNKNEKEHFSSENKAFKYLFLYEIKRNIVIKKIHLIMSENGEFFNDLHNLDAVLDLFKQYRISEKFWNNDVGYSIKFEKVDDLYKIHLINPYKQNIYEATMLLEERDFCLTLFIWVFEIAIFLNFCNYYNEKGLLNAKIVDEDLIFMIDSEK